MSDPPLSDIIFKNKMAWVWSTLKFLIQAKNFEVIMTENKISLEFLMGTVPLK